ncbi:MAG: hypothetical protein IKD09_08110, partial [Lentisphaeria bacterium]|nr:hypothetical protein [Lentisphaeria bacterium]
SFRKKAGGQLENFATLKQSLNRHIAPTQITIVQPDGWLLGCGECNQLPTKKNNNFDHRSHDLSTATPGIHVFSENGVSPHKKTNSVD